MRREVFIKITLVAMLLLTVTACSKTTPIPKVETTATSDIEEAVKVEAPKLHEEALEEPEKKQLNNQGNPEFIIEFEGYQQMPDGTLKMTEEAAAKFGKESFMSLEEVTEEPDNARVVTVDEMIMHIRNNDSGNFLVSDEPAYKSILEEMYPMSVYQAEEDEEGPASKYEYKRADADVELWGNIKRYKNYIYWELYFEE